MTSFTDGEWHRLHPATPFLKGGITLVAIVGIVVVNLRDALVNLVVGARDEGEPLVWLADHGFVGIAVLVVLGGLLLLVGGFYVSWRMHTFRITDEVVEVRSGVVFRTNRRGRLDRIQGINIVRPFIARLFGAARLEVNVAGQDANVQLSYLGSAAADELRLEILRLASGRLADEATASGALDPAVAEEARASAAAVAAAGGDESAQAAARESIIEKRVSELLAPELDPKLASAESVVTMHTGRLIGSLLLSGTTIFLLLFVVGSIVAVVLSGEFFALVPLFPAVIGMGSYTVTRFTKSLRYSIAGTDDGIRVGFGLFSTSNETLPPGRIHAVEVSQPLLWRASGWWEIKLNRASTSHTKGAAGQANTTILPVGNLADVRKVLELVLPGLVDPESIAILERGLTSKGGDDGFVNSPRRAVWLRWFSWRRNGFVLAPGAVIMRSGAVWRQLIIVPLARAQSVGVEQGPLRRRLGLATIRVHTVAGPVDANLGAVDAGEAMRFYSEVSALTATSIASDTAHRWRSDGVTA